MSKLRKIPKKNYFILLALAVITVLLTIYINAWMKTYKENKLSISPFRGEVEEVNLEEISVTFSEMNEVILYVGYTNDKNVYNMEEKLLKYIKSNDLVDKFIYVDVTDYMSDNRYVKILKDIFDEVKDKIENAPILIYVKNGKAEKVINSKKGIINTYEISKLNESYELN